MLAWLQKYFFEFTVTSTVGGIMAYLKRKRSIEKEQRELDRRRMDAMEGGVRALLRDRLISAIHKAKKQGYIYMHELENIDKMYTEYKNLGGNGAIIHLMREVANLRTETDMK